MDQSFNLVSRRPATGEPRGVGGRYGRRLAGRAKILFWVVLVVIVLQQVYGSNRPEVARASVLERFQQEWKSRVIALIHREDTVTPGDAGARRRPREGGVSPLARPHPTIEGCRGSRIDLEERGRHLNIPRNRSVRAFTSVQGSGCGTRPITTFGFGFAAAALLHAIRRGMSYVEIGVPIQELAGGISKPDAG